VVSVTGPVSHSFSESNWQQKTEHFYKELSMKGVFLLFNLDFWQYLLLFLIQKVQVDPGRGLKKFSPTPAYTEHVHLGARLRNPSTMLEACTLHLILTALSKLKEILDPFLVSMSNYRVQQSQMIIHWHSVFSDM